MTSPLIKLLRDCVTGERLVAYWPRNPLTTSLWMIPGTENNL